MEIFNLDLAKIIVTIGLVGIFLIVFAESGILIGVIFPGDSLLFTAGFLASRGIFELPLLILTCFVATVLGNFVGYAFGHKVGRRLFNKEDSIWFHKNHLIKAEEFYKRHGGKTIILARFLPIIRVFAPIVAGMGRMHIPAFVFYNVLGGGVWVLGLTSAGFFLGQRIPNIDSYLLPIIAVIIILSFLPTLISLYKNRH